VILKVQFWCHNKSIIALLKKGAELTEHEWFAQCMGCGTFGIKIVDDARIAELSQ
jgi:hypothetical protein